MRKMRKKEITKEFLFAGITAEREVYKENEFIELIKDELKNLIEFSESENNEDSEKYKEAIKELDSETKAENAIEAYRRACDYEYDEYAEERYKEVEEAKAEDAKIEHLINEYMKIIRNLPDCEFEIEFSVKSPSIYIKIDRPATEEEVENFLNLQESIFVDCNNVYEEIEYDPDEKIEIRLSDHEFGGFTKFGGYGDYVSYEKICVNYIVKI